MYDIEIRVCRTILILRNFRIKIRWSTLRCPEIFLLMQEHFTLTPCYGLVAWLQYISMDCPGVEDLFISNRAEDEGKGKDVKRSERY